MQYSPYTLVTSASYNAIITAALPGIVLACLWVALWCCLRQCSPQIQHPKGCRKLGLPPSQSNLQDEFDLKYSQGLSEESTDEDGRPSWCVKALFAYPIKSCAGLELDAADVVATGFALDRQFCFAEDISTTKSDQSRGTESNGQDSSIWTARTLRDRDFNKMALIRPEIWIPDPKATDYSPDLEEIQSQGVMIIYYPRVGHGGIHSLLVNIAIALRLITREEFFRVPLVPPPNHAYPTVPVKIWKDSPPSYDYGQHIPASLRRYLSTATRLPFSDSPSGSSRAHHSPSLLTLFRVNPSHHRQIFRCAPRKETLGFQTVTGFADAYPLHILSLSSVHDVAARCATAIPKLSVRRFRANIILQGPAAFAEDDWKKILIKPSQSQGKGDGVVIHTVCRTIRCRLPNVDPDTGIRHRSEPDKTLKSYRRIDRGDLTNACLGMQAVPAVQEFKIRVGDSISVIETGEHFYIKMLAPGEKIPGV